MLWVMVTCVGAFCSGFPLFNRAMLDENGSASWLEGQVLKGDEELSLSLDVWLPGRRNGEGVLLWSQGFWVPVI